jgi:nucleoid DNA-binding protein
MAATTMTKTQLVAFMAEKIAITKKQAASFFDTLAELAVKEAKKMKFSWRPVWVA